MIRVAISVEGQTEYEFCEKILVPHFRDKSIELTPIIVATSRKKCGTKHKGGCINLDRVANEISKLLPNFDYVTTFYDLYGFSGIDESMPVEDLEEVMYGKFDNIKYIPYVQKYEFETLLFSDANYYEELLTSDAKVNMDNIINAHEGNIENINNSKETAPSKRIEKIFTDNNETYDKVFHGYSIIEEIGLSKVREKSCRFNAWLKKIEALSQMENI